jgi:hypothetical protein
MGWIDYAKAFDSVLQPSSDLTFRQKVDVHNSTIVPALTYVSSNVIKGGGKYETLLSKGEQLNKRFRKSQIQG